jgi:hypothetical protein
MACRSGGAEMVDADELVQVPPVDHAAIGAWPAQAVEQLSRGLPAEGLAGDVLPCQESGG